MHKTELLYRVRMTFYPQMGEYDKKWMYNFLVVQFKVRLRFSLWAINNIFGLDLIYNSIYFHSI